MHYGGVSLFSDTSSDEITADFDVILGFDMSSDMYGFDYNGEMAWLDDFKALSEQDPEGTRFAVVTNEAGVFTTDLNTEIEERALLTYSGDSDIIALLDNCLNTFDEASADRNKVVIATAANISDVSELESKIEELQSYGVIPFVFVMNEEVTSELENIYDCCSALKLRIAISELYYSLVEFKNAETIDEYQTMTLSEETTPTISTSIATYTSDLRRRHIYNNMADRGSSLISILNMYSCLPLYAVFKTEFGTEFGYNLTWAVDSDVKNGNISIDTLIGFLNGNSNVLDNYDDLNGFRNLWSEIYNSYKNTENIEDIIIKNLKKRFPVVITYMDTVVNSGKK